MKPETDYAKPRWLKRCVIKALEQACERLEHFIARTSMFRASPWISYAPGSARPHDDDENNADPDSHHHQRDHGHRTANITDDAQNKSASTNLTETDMAAPHDHRDDDVDMDAPQISTLREDASPPPSAGASAAPAASAQPARTSTSKFRIKLKVNEPPPTASAPTAHGSPPSGRAHRDQDSDQDYDLEDLDEEDQLADDDDAPSTPLPRPTARRGIRPDGRGGRGGRGRGRGRGAAMLGASEPPQTIFELFAGPAQSHTPAGYDTGEAGFGTPISSGKPPRKRAKKGEGEKKTKVVKKPRYGLSMYHIV